MKYIVAAETDIGISKKVNQDSICVKNAETKQGKAALVMICDGMGGLSSGELASAEVVRSFSDWFDYELAYELEKWSWRDAGQSVLRRLMSLNSRIINYGRINGTQLGTTTTGILAVNNQMMTFHVGDSRIYKLSYQIKQLTEDHTFVNREMKKGTMTEEQAKTDPRRNALTQCIGVSGDITPEIKFGSIENGTNYLICSDGFRHVITEDEIFDGLSPKRITTKSSMQARLRELIETVKSRKETDNISAVMFRAEY
ncbi:MAG: serine/threonine-protein phosphatase [Ruminococcus sp.]|nr:serine/threonine-protein phosphatase [Ruminococcus sp.]